MGSKGPSGEGNAGWAAVALGGGDMMEGREESEGGDG